MKEALKNKAVNLYLNKTEKEDFERELYELVEISDFKKGTFFYDLVTLNYRDINYRKNLFKLLEENSSEEELLCLEIYEKSVLIIKSDKQKEILSIIDNLASLCYETDYKYKTLFSFYRLSDGISLKEEGFSFMSFKEIVIEAKIFSREIVEKFNRYKIDEDWSELLESLPNKIVNTAVEKPFKKEIFSKVVIAKKWYKFWK